MMPRLLDMERALHAIILVLVIVAIDGKPASYKENLIDSDFNKTIEEVVGILGKRPDLPRLTRGEILELVSDVRQQKSLEKNKNSQEPLVVVMPFNPNGTSIEELYTKSPVTQVIGELAAKLATKKPGQKRRRKPIPRPVYIHTEPTIQPTTPLVVSETTTPVSTTPTITPRITTIPTTTTTEKAWFPLEELEIPENMKDAIEDISVKPSSPRPFSVVTPKPKKPTVKPSIPPEDVSVAAESLSDEMKDLLATFGLLGKNKDVVETSQVQPKDPDLGFEFGLVKPKVDPNSYIGFKPLPDGGDDGMSPDMKEFLASFGLINERRGKSMKSETTSKQKRSKERDDKMLKEVPEINSEMFSDDMMSVLENLGITNRDESRKGKRLGQHIFNPAQHTAELNKTDQIGKIQQLVSKIRELSESQKIHELTPSELKELLKTEAELIQLGADGNLLIKTDSLDDTGGPDPLSLDEIVELIDKNESKRQESSEEQSSSSEPNLIISTRRYDNADNVTYTDSKVDAITEAIKEDSTPQQSTVNAVTISPQDKSNNQSSVTENLSEAGSLASASSVSASASASASATSTADISSSASATSSAASGDERASSSSSSSSASGDDTSSASASASASSASSSSSVSSDSLPTAAEGPSFDDLSESFGGEITTTPRPNGLFFLLDWNSFLNVGTDERKVDLSFNPKIGDPKNFYPIKFP